MNLSRALCSQTVRRVLVADGRVSSNYHAGTGPIVIDTFKMYLSIDHSFPPRTGLSIFASAELKGLEKAEWAVTGDRWVDV